MFIGEIFDIVKMAILSNLNYRFNVIPNKCSESYFVHTDHLILKFYMEG